MIHLHLLLALKFTLLKNAFLHLQRRSRIEFATLILFFLGGSAFFFLLFFHSFRFFKGQEPFGPILIDESFYLFTFTLFVMLVISTAISSYVSLFRSQEVPFLVSRPVEWNEIYFVKVVEALWFSSWSFLFVVVPFMAAYGLNKNVGLVFFPVLCFLFFLPFVILAGTLGTLASTLTVWLLPSRKRRRISIFLAVAAAVIFFVRVEPQVVKEQGSLMGVMSGYLPQVAFAKDPLLPSTWVTRGILALSNPQIAQGLGWQDGIFYFLLLLANMLFFLIPSFSAAHRLYPAAYLRSQDYGEAQPTRRVGAHRDLEKILDLFPWPSRPAMAFFEKDIKTFVREPAEWSQLIIFFGLLLVYFANLRNLEFHVLKDFWKNLVFVLNTVGTYIVLSSFNMRFVFPMLSLEGSRIWIIGLAPIRFSSLLLEKFLFGTVFSLILTLPLVFLSGWMLEISFERVVFVTGLGFFVCVALTGLSVGLGAKFPNFKSNNPAEIISGFGGSLLLVTHLIYLSLIGAFLVFSQKSHWLILLTVAFGSLLAGILPIRLGIASLKRMEF